MHCWEAWCLEFVDKAFSNGPGCDWAGWLSPEPVPGERRGWQVPPCWPPAEQGTVPASRGMEGAGWWWWSHSSCLGQLSCSRTCWGISMLWIGEASQQVKNIYVFSWTLPGMMCQVKNPAHWQGFLPRRWTSCTSIADRWAWIFHREGRHALPLRLLSFTSPLVNPRCLLSQAGDFLYIQDSLLIWKSHLIRTLKAP